MKNVAIEHKPVTLYAITKQTKECHRRLVEMTSFNSVSRKLIGYVVHPVAIDVEEFDVFAGALDQIELYFSDRSYIDAVKFFTEKFGKYGELA